MEKKQTKPIQKVSLRLQTETLRRLDDAKLVGVAGGVRIWKPVGFADDTTPIYEVYDRHHRLAVKFSL